MDFKLLGGLINSGEIEKFKDHHGKTKYYIRFSKSGKENFTGNLAIKASGNMAEILNAYMSN